MNKEEAIKYLQQLYPNGGHCWLDEQRIEAISMAINALQEEPVSEDLKVELNKYIKDHFTIDTEQLDRFGVDEKDYIYSMDKSDMLAMVEHFINWHKTKEEPVSEDLEEAVNAYIGYAPEVDESSSVYGKRQAFKVGANWQKQQTIDKALAWVDENFFFNNLHHSIENHTFECMEEMFDDLRKNLED